MYGKAVSILPPQKSIFYKKNQQVVFVAILAVVFGVPAPEAKPEAKPTLYATPVVASAPVVAAPVAYSAAYSAPLAYASPVAYSYPYAAPYVTVL